MFFTDVYKEAQIFSTLFSLLYSLFSLLYHHSSISALSFLFLSALSLCSLLCFIFTYILVNRAWPWRMSYLVTNYNKIYLMFKNIFYHDFQALSFILAIISFTKRLYVTLVHLCEIFAWSTNFLLIIGNSGLVSVFTT